jgi:hypothetical protein
MMRTERGNRKGKLNFAHKLRPRGVQEKPILIRWTGRRVMNHEELPRAVVVVIRRRRRSFLRLRIPLGCRMRGVGRSEVGEGGTCVRC